MSGKGDRRRPPSDIADKDWYDKIDWDKETNGED